MRKRIHHPFEPMLTPSACDRKGPWRGFSSKFDLGIFHVRNLRSARPKCIRRVLDG